jgi:hypothetical protein
LTWGTKGHQDLGASGPAGPAPIFKSKSKSKSSPQTASREHAVLLSTRKTERTFRILLQDK